MTSKFAKQIERQSKRPNVKEAEEQYEFISNIDPFDEDNLDAIITSFINAKPRIRNDFDNLLYMRPKDINDYIVIFLESGEEMEQKEITPLQFLRQFIAENELESEIDHNRKIMEKEGIRGEGYGTLLETILEEDDINKIPDILRNFALKDLNKRSSVFIISYLDPQLVKDVLEERVRDENIDKEIIFDTILSDPNIRNEVVKIISNVDEYPEDLKDVLRKRGYLTFRPPLQEEKRRTKPLDELKTRRNRTYPTKREYTVLDKRKYITVSDIFNLSTNDTDIEENIRNLGLEELEFYTKISDSDYVQKIEDSIFQNSDTYGEYLHKIAEVVFPLYSPYFADYSKIYKSRIESKFYIPSQILYLDIKDKLSEVFNNPLITSEQRNVISRSFTEGVNDLSYTYGDRLLSRIYPERKISAEKAFNPLNVSTPQYSIKLLCDNPEYSNPRDVIIFTDEDDNSFCFLLLQITKQIQDGNFINPYTEKKFPEEFIKRVKNYSYDNIQEVELEEIFGNYDESEKQQTTEKINIPDLLPGFTELILKDLEQREAELISGDKKISCEYCTKSIGKEMLKSVIYKGRKPNIVSFCNLECFKNYDY